MGIATELVYLAVGVAIFAGAVLPALLERSRLTVPIAFLCGGLAIGLIPLRGRLAFDPTQHLRVTERLTEVCILIALMGVGLAMPRALAWRSWAPTWRLLLVAMPAIIAVTTMLGWAVAGLAPVTALLVASALAPTDPVLASDVQVGGPGAALDQTPDGEEPDDEADSDEVRFALTSEAGFNDGLAFPFVYLAIMWAESGALGAWVGEWVAWTLVGKTLLGLVVGLGTGWILTRVLFRGSHNIRIADAGEPIIALGATLAIYGLTEVLGGWGFVAVFAAGLGLRTFERTERFHQELHEFLGRLEHLLTWLLLLALGVAIADGLLDALTWRSALVAAGLVLAVRPLIAWLSLHGSVLGPRERIATAFFGVRGVGSVYYLAYAFSHHTFPGQREAWSLAALTIVLSVILHGLTAQSAMKFLDAQRDEIGRAAV